MASICRPAETLRHFMSIQSAACLSQVILIVCTDHVPSIPYWLTFSVCVQRVQ